MFFYIFVFISHNLGLSQQKICSPRNPPLAALSAICISPSLSAPSLLPRHPPTAPTIAAPPHWPQHLGVKIVHPFLGFSQIKNRSAPGSLEICSKRKFPTLNLGRDEALNIVRVRMAEEVPQTMNKQALKRLSSDLENQDSRKHNKRGKGSFLKLPDSSLRICKNHPDSSLKMQGSVSSSEPQCSSRADSKSVSRVKVIQKSPTVVLALGVQIGLQESRSRSGTEKRTRGGDVEPETLPQERPLLPDLNEEFCDPDAEPNTASPIKSNGLGGLG